MAKQTMKFKATQYIIRAMHEMTYIDFDHIICDREETPEDIRTWWENLNWKTQRRYGYFWMDMLEQGYFLRERTPDFYYKWQLGEIFVEFWETRDREEAERIERERKFQEEYEAKLEEKRRESFWAIVKEVHAEAQEAPADDDSNDTPAPEETPVADTEPADDDDDYVITIETPLGQEKECFKDNKITAFYHAERRADFLSVNGKTISLNWNYTPLKSGDIVWLKSAHENLEWQVSHMWSADEYVIVSGDNTMTVGIAQITRENPNPPAPKLEDFDLSDLMQHAVDLIERRGGKETSHWLAIAGISKNTLNALVKRGLLKYFNNEYTALWDLMVTVPEPADDDDDYNDENHGDLTIELPQEYAVFNLHGKYEELANVMDGRLEKQFRLTTDLFGDSDEPVTIADIDDILDADAYEGWNVFVDGWWDNELRLYAQRADADSEDATPSLYSDWVMIDPDHGYLTIGTPV
jgi:hypothetical protein